jgi:hypothetical protein
MSESMPSSLQIAVSFSKGIRTPGSEETVSKMATLGFFFASREALMESLKTWRRSSSSSGYCRSICLPRTMSRLYSQTYSTVLPQAP